jgi:hypothetical protein
VSAKRTRWNRSHANVRLTPVHLRLPAIDPGVKAFLWALFLSLYLWAFMLAVGVDKGTATVVGLISFGAFFLCVRVYGENQEA